MIARAPVKIILPLACSWVRKQEALIMARGRALAGAQIETAPGFCARVTETARSGRVSFKERRFPNRLLFLSFGGL